MKIPEILIVETIHQPGSLAKVLQVIADAGLAIEHLTALRRDQGRTLWEITLEMDEEADRSLYERIGQLPNARFVGKSDRVFNRHRGGKIRTVASVPINTRRYCATSTRPEWRACVSPSRQRPARRPMTSLPSTAPSPSSPTAPRCSGSATSARSPGLPVMEGKAALFADLVGINGVPILLRRPSRTRVVDDHQRHRQSFGAIQLEDFAAPECFEIEQQLRARLAKPVLHDDQHGTAVVALAALINAARHAGATCGAASSGRSASARRARASCGCCAPTACARCSARTAIRAAVARLEASGRRGRDARGDHAARRHRDRVAPA